MCFRTFFALGITATLGLAFITAPDAIPQDLRGQGAVNANRYSKPWTNPGFRGYREPVGSMRVINPSAAPVQPTKYEVYSHALPVKSKDGNVAELVAHVPEHAEVFVGSNVLKSDGDTRYFSSPALEPGYTYSYTVRVNWIEEGKKVTQSHDVIVKPGEMSCFYLIEKGTGFDTPKEVISDSLEKLSAEDRKLAQAQKFCAVQNGVLLGAMGAPKKIDIKGEPVFLCCAACEGRARSDATKTLTAVANLKAKTSAPIK